MLSIKFIRENPEEIKKSLEKRKESEKIKWIDKILALDEKWRKLKYDVDKLKHKRNELSKRINELKKQKKDVKKVLEEVKNIPNIIKSKDTEAEKIFKEIRGYLLRLPNILHESVPYGKDEEDNVELKRFGKMPDFDFKLKSHTDIIIEKELADIERAAKISGARWYFLKGDLALLEMALTKYAIDFMIKRGYQLTIPPHMMKRKAYEGVTSLDDFEEMLYKIDGEDLYMIATSEHPLTAQFMGDVLKEDSLPLKIVGYSTNFRKEAGTHGKDTKGIFRVHQFNKVEQIVVCKPEESWKIHEELIKNAIDFFESLGLYFRQVNICTGDIGIVAAKKYDLEVWMPVQKRFREVVSCSNCTSYQAVRLNIKYSTNEGNMYVHTLNSTCVATSRALVAIIENFQNKDGSIRIPDVLVPYMNGKKVIGK